MQLGFPLMLFRFTVFQESLNRHKEPDFVCDHSLVLTVYVSAVCMETIDKWRKLPCVCVCLAGKLF